jgi:hypothetical protein
LKLKKYESAFRKVKEGGKVEEGSDLELSERGSSSSASLSGSVSGEGEAGEEKLKKKLEKARVKKEAKEGKKEKQKEEIKELDLTLKKKRGRPSKKSSTEDKGYGFPKSASNSASSNIMKTELTCKNMCPGCKTSCVEGYKTIVKDGGGVELVKFCSLGCMEKTDEKDKSVWP